MGSNDFGIVVKRLPAFLGGGIQKDMVKSGEMIFYCPLWTSVYRLTSEAQSSRFAGKGRGDNPHVNDAVNARAYDGNEVWLGITVQWRQLMPKDPSMILRKIGPRLLTNKDFNSSKDMRSLNGQGSVQELVQSYVRSKTRINLGQLYTADFYDNHKRYEKNDITKREINKILSEFSVDIDSINLDSHEFDKEYQDLIDKTRGQEQLAEAEERRIATVKADKERALQDKIGEVNKLVADAEGERQQAKDRSSGNFKAKENTAKAILIEGQNESSWIRKKIEALNRPGGKKVVMMEIAQNIIDSGAPYYVIDEGSSGGGNMNFRKLDMNKMLQQLGAASLGGEHPAE
jgi:hypothetical protein